MGVVYCARHSYLKTQHAIKVILPDLVGNDPQLVTRFRQEALAAAAIRHHNVVSVTDYGVAQDTMPFIVMEFVEGESLHDLLDREKRLSPEKAVELMAAICAGVGAAHRQGIVHRDLKPLNIMILKHSHTMAEGVKILDFGLAKIKSGELLGSFVQAQTTGMMGSPYYMSPEQWADEEPTAQADIYSLGVMLFQMLAGDVPFKGSSIPAIMKKHLSDAPPSFAAMGVEVPLQIELAVRHTLEKEKEKRTATVQQMVDELKAALGYGSQPSIHLPEPPAVSTVHVLTSPPQAKVFIDNVHVGESQPDGWLMIDGLQTGNHRLRISKEGFQDWENQVLCEGKPQQVIAQLQNAQSTLNNPAQVTQQIQPNTPPNLVDTQGAQNSGFQQPNFVAATGYQNSQPIPQSGQQFAATAPPVQKSGISLYILAIAGIFGVLLLTVIGIFVAVKTGLIGYLPGSVTPNVNSDNRTPTPAPPIAVKNEMLSIPGGKFMMGSSDGPLREQPAHPVEVKDFLMDKTEVTNGEYYEFIKQSGYKTPANWAEGKPVPGRENFPVVFVSSEDVKKFIEWRSTRDNVTYRLPTEEEWEYAARNGDANNLFPWGDKWEPGRAVIEQAAAIAVGSVPSGANKWGVVDLIGNVWEWTDSKVKPYPNSQIGFSKPSNIVIRGGSFNSKSTGEAAITATTRADVEPLREDGLLGFRLVRSK